MIELSQQFALEFGQVPAEHHLPIGLDLGAECSPLHDLNLALECVHIGLPGHQIVKQAVKVAHILVVGV